MFILVAIFTPECVLKRAFSYMVSMSVADHTGQAWLSGFHETGLAIFDRSADEMMALKDSDESAFLAAIQRAVNYTYNFACRARIDTYNVSLRLMHQSRFMISCSRVLVVFVFQ